MSESTPLDRPFSSSSAHAGGLLTVDLGAVANNWRHMAALMGAKEAAGVVKANAYGLGVEAVGRVLAAAGCRTFFVAVPEEGVLLRKVLPGAVIYVLSGPIGGSEGLAPFLTSNLRPILNCADQVALWRSHAPGAAPYGLHLETGMNRLGLPEFEARAMATNLTPSLVISHLACADVPNHPLTEEQVRAFTELRSLYPTARASLANSAGVMLGRDYHFDLARPGLALYGGNPLPHLPNPLAQVLTLQLRVLQVRRVDTPQSVGYGATYRAPAGTVLATVAAGYADGLLRSLGNSGWGLLGGVRVPVAGRVSMDLITFDVSEAPSQAVYSGALITLIGRETADSTEQAHTLDELATEAGTIPYELLTSLSRRYARRYVGGAGS
ncbi:alanine racemase [Insolitispirillum peregrinum]